MESEEDFDGEITNNNSATNFVNNKIKRKHKSKNEDNKKPKIEKNKRNKTISIAVPISIIDSCLSLELQTILVGEIARISTVFQVNEIIVYNDKIKSSNDIGTKTKDPSSFFMRVLQYIETPLYLRKALFPVHPDLKYAGLLSPLYAPHHLDNKTWCKYREGITVSRPIPTGLTGTYVNIGLMRDAFVDKVLKPSIRVTLELDSSCNINSKKCIFYIFNRYR